MPSISAESWWREPGGARHRADRPVGGVRRCRPQRAFNHGCDLIIIDSARPARASFIQQTFDAVPQKTTPPLANGMLVNAQLGCNGLARDTFGTTKNDPTPLGQ